MGALGDMRIIGSLGPSKVSAKLHDVIHVTLHLIH